MLKSQLPGSLLQTPTDDVVVQCTTHFLDPYIPQGLHAGQYRHNSDWRISVGELLSGDVPEQRDGARAILNFIEEGRAVHFLFCVTLYPAEGAQAGHNWMNPHTPSHDG